MSPREHDCVSTVHSTEMPVYTKPVLRSSGPVEEKYELAVVYDTAEEVVGPAESAFGHTKEAATCYLGLATDYLASFKAAQLGLKAADGVLDTLDRATRCEDDCREVDFGESLPVQKFGDMNFNVEGYNSEGDSDYCPSEDCEEDDLEYDSEAEVSDDEAEVVCEKAKANIYVRSLQRQCRAIRRAGTKRAGTARPVETIGEVSLVGAICETFNLNFLLSVVGLKLEPVNKMMVKQVIDATEDADEDEDEEEEIAFSELNLKDYDSEEDADYCPSESEEDSELEYDSEAEIADDEDTEVFVQFCELDFKSYISEDDDDYSPSESDLEDEAESCTRPVTRSNVAVGGLNCGLNMKEYEENVDFEYDSDENDMSEEESDESDEEDTEEGPTQKFGEMNFEDYNSGEDAAYCPSESDDFEWAETSTKPVLRNSASVAELNTGLTFKEYEEDVDYCSSESSECPCVSSESSESSEEEDFCSSESEEDSEDDSDTETSSESDEE